MMREQGAIPRDGKEAFTHSLPNLDEGLQDLDEAG
jgi:hypothetical protein